MVVLLWPIIAPLNLLSKKISRDNPAASISRDEIINFIRLGYFQGTIASPEYTIMENLFRLETIRIKEIMTPRTVVFWLDQSSTVAEVLKEDGPPRFSRIPLYDGKTNTITGIVLRRDIMDCMANKKTRTKICELAAKPEYVQENARVPAFQLLIEKKVQLMVVINEYGDYVGVVTMEDAIETLLGVEIVDEFDPAEDMQKVAHDQGKKKLLRNMKKKV
jgi:CBS domain containing-hemolysin-like protein